MKLLNNYSAAASLLFMLCLGCGRGDTTLFGRLAEAPSFWLPCSAASEAPATLVQPALALRQLDSTEILAIGVDGSLVESTNSGDRWERVLPEGRCHRPLRAVAPGSSTKDLACVVATDGQRTFCSRADGMNWQFLAHPQGRPDLTPTSDPVHIARVAEGAPRIYRLYHLQLPPCYGTCAILGGQQQVTVGVTDDVGQSWHVPEALFDMHLAVAAYDHGVVLERAFWRHGGSGSAWYDHDLKPRTLTETSRGVAALNPWRPGERLVRDAGTPSGVRVDVDGVLGPQNKVSQPWFIAWVAFLDGARPFGTLLARDDDDGLHVSRDGNATWQTIGQMPGHDCQEILVGSRGLLVACDGAAFRSRDAGRRWDALALP